MNRRLRTIIAAVENGDRVLLAAMAVLLFLGSIVVYGTGAYRNPGSGSILGQHFMISKHVFMIGVGLLLMLTLANLNYSLLRWRWLNWSALVMSLALMVLTLVQGDGHQINRWVTVLGFSFQPVELAKMAVIFFLADSWADAVKQDRLGWREVWPALAFGALPLFYVLFEQPNFGNLLTMGLVILAMLLVTGFPWRRMAVAVAVPLGGAVGAYLVSSKLQTRFGEWFLGWRGGSFGYQVDQSIMGMGAGGPLGLGVGKGHNKFNFLPEAHTDFIYSVLGEEMGLWGTLLVIAALMVFVWRGYVIAARASEPFGRMVATGLTTSLAVYGVFNIAMVTGLFPVVGVPLPFVSFGGTAMVMALAAVGILLNIDQMSTIINLRKQRARDRSTFFMDYPA
ncbi:hypothetical protein CSB20_02480 [bacterium DOLZORAL124_64_63]|nr:MAG: hypothetical protein CSB20_02480 [bacterium DOLZORAL124_64_63]